jgi:hypothetical protein
LLMGWYSRGVDVTVLGAGNFLVCGTSPIFAIFASSA